MAPGFAAKPGLCPECGAEVSPDALDGLCPRCLFGLALDPLSDSLADQTLSHYKVLEKLAAGGMGEIYLARDTRLGRNVALKLLPRRSGSDPEKIRRFEREARATSALNHPNIVTVYDIGVVEERRFIVMELVEGRTLRELLGKGSMLDAIPRLGGQMVRALGAAHAAGIAHRDVKPENVMVRDDGYVKVLDFGLARLMTAELTAAESLFVSSEHPGRLVGTVRYMSPEQAQGANQGPASDIFSLGLVFYEMAADRHPFEADSVWGVLRAIASETPSPPSRWNPAIPRELEDLILAMLEKDPASRPTAAAVDRALAPVIAEPAGGAHFKGSRDRTTDSSEPQRTATGVAADVRDAAPVKIPSQITRAASTKRRVAAWGSALLLAAAAFVVFQSGSVSQRSPIPATRTQITFSGWVLGPEISPDGQFLAYFDGYSRKLMVRDLSSGQAVPVFEGGRVFEDGSFGSLRWSPDGSRLLVSFILSDGPSSFVLPRLGGPAQRLPYFFYLSWSPDGTRYAGANVNSSAISFVDIATGAVTSTQPLRDLQWMGSIDWSPRGDLLLFASTDENLRHSLWTVRLDGTQQRQIYESGSGVASPRWSPDGSAINFLTGPHYNSTLRLWKVGVSLSSGRRIGEPTMVLDGLQSILFSLSRDSKRLAYRSVIERSNLWLAERVPSGDIRTQELTTGTWRHTDPTVSPDGRRIAFVRREGEKSNVFTMPMEGGEPKQITHLNAITGGPAWSPDGKRIAFGSLKGGSHRLWVVAAEGGPARPFASTRAGQSWVGWAPSPKIVYVETGNQNLRVLDPASEQETPLLDRFGGYVFFPRFSPSLRDLFIYRNHRGADLWLIPSEGSRGAGFTKLTGRSTASVYQTVDARNYRAREIRFRGMVRAELSGDDPGGAGCYLTVVREAGNAGFFDATHEDDRRTRSAQWTPCEASGRVDEDAVRIRFGATLEGVGRAWLDDFHLSVKDDGGEWRPLSIENPSFEEEDSERMPAGWFTEGFPHLMRTVDISHHGAKSLLMETRPLSEGRFHPIGWSADGSAVYAFNTLARSVVVISSSGGPAQTLFEWPFPRLWFDPYGFNPVAMSPDALQFVFVIGQSQSDAWIIDNFDPQVP